MTKEKEGIKEKEERERKDKHKNYQVAPPPGIRKKKTRENSPAKTENNDLKNRNPKHE